MVFIVYEPGSKAYRFYNPNMECVLISRDAVFEEGRAWGWDDKSASSASVAPICRRVCDAICPGRREPTAVTSSTITNVDGGYFPCLNANDTSTGSCSNGVAYTRSGVCVPTIGGARPR